MRRILLVLAMLCFSPLAARAQTVVQLPAGGTSYTICPNGPPCVDLDGPTGPLATALKSKARVRESNPPYAALTEAVNTWDAGKYLTNPQNDYYSNCASAAIRWWADGDTRSLVAARYCLDNLPNIAGNGGNGFYCNQTAKYCGDSKASDLDWVSGNMDQVMTAFSIVRSQMTSTEITNFANMVLNDNSTTANGLGGSESSPTSNCTPQPKGVAWAAGNCGLVWWMKHHLAAPPLIPGQASNYPADYPVSGGTYVPVWGNLTLTKLFGYIAIGIGLARDDSRAVVLLKQSYAYYIDNQWGYDKSRFTGLTHAGAAYTSWREVPYTAAIAFMLKQSGGPDLTGGNYISNALAYFNYIEEPWDLTTISSWGDIYGPAQSYQGFSNYGAWMAMTVFPTLPYSAYYYNQNVSRPDWTVTGIKVNQGTEVGRAYMFVDPHHASTSYKSSPLQYVFMDTDYASCVALSASGGVAHGATCYPNIGVQGVISRSDWTLTGSTIQLQAGTAAFPDHMVSTWGSYHILRKDPLLAGNGSQGGNWNGQLENDNVVELGGGANWNSLGAAIYPSYAPITHWAGTDPTGDAAGRYAYWMVDLSRTYTPAMDVSRAERSCIHFKKAGHQDYLTCYDDIATTSGKQETDFFHYYIHSSTISPSGGKVTVGTNTVTLIRASSSLVSSFLPLVSNGIYTSLRGNDSNGNSAVVTVCASTTGSSCNTSATSGEWIAVHLPSTSTSAAMPTLTQPSCTGTGGNCTVVQIADSSYPKVAAFARQGVTLSGVSFTTTHSGTAQYLIAGMVPGNYSVSVNGATVVSSVTVNANDNTLYFESTAGLVQTRSLGQR